MGDVLDHLMADVKRLTACRTKCPHCGHVGMALWTLTEDVCKCRSCGKKFRFKANTYRPKTGGMTNEERRAYYRSLRRRKADYTPEEWERQKEMSRIRNERYRERHRQEIRSRNNERNRRLRQERSGK